MAKNIHLVTKNTRNDFKRLLHNRNFYKQKHRVNCTLTTQEYQELIDSAYYYGFKPTTFLKKTALSYIRKKYIVPLHIENSLQELIFLFRKIGNNLNQIAQNSNQAKKITNFFELKKELTNLYKAEDTLENFFKNKKDYS